MDKAELKNIYIKMRSIRAFEEKVADLFAANKIPGFVHLCIGQEAVAVGACACLKESDYLVSTHRGHGHMIAKGADIRCMLAELLGRTGGFCKGKGGSMHISDFGIGALGANGIVGGGLPIANGAAFSAKYKGTDQVVVCFFGDGASNQGTFHESLNLAALWKLPVIFVCENNGWSEFTAQRDSMCIANISDRAGSYGIPGRSASGTDVLSVIEASREAIDRARNRGGPTLLEFKTYRWRGHYEGDPQKYRSEEELREAKSEDPIDKLAQKLVKNKSFTKHELDELDKKIYADVEEAASFAADSPIQEFSNEPEKAYA
jgi:pyruvate dehydrogenase E1 component alpha subunit